MLSLAESLPTLPFPLLLLLPLVLAFSYALVWRYKPPSGIDSQVEKGNFSHEKLNVLIITDPGPDPDDAKVILMAGVQHLQGQVNVTGIVTNGGQQSEARAQLATAILAGIGVTNIPVAHGAPGRKENPSPQVFNLDGFDQVDKGELLQGRDLIFSVLTDAKPKSLTIQIQSAGTDIAEAIKLYPSLIKAKVCKVSVMGGVELKADEHGVERWTSDAAQNNLFDPEAMESVYQYCISNRIPLHVVSRNAVPNIPMRVAQEYAGSGMCVLEYLAMMQESGLVSLWKNVRKTGPERTLPARCNAQWYWTTFCGVSEAEFQSLQGAAVMDDIRPHLRGTIKPYDVVSYMTILPQAKEWFSFESSKVQIDGINHHFFVDAKHMPSAECVINQLTDIYNRSLAICTANSTSDCNPERPSSSSSTGRLSPPLLV